MIHDISIPMSAGTREWPGDQRFDCGWTCRIDRGDSVNLGAITTSFHVGTHADAPLHVQDGWPASESLTVSAFMGPVRVITAPRGPLPHTIGIAALRILLGASMPARILLRTGISVAEGAFPDDWPVLSPEAAHWLVDEGVVLWGVDAPSVDHRNSKTLDVHHALLGRGAYVLENLDLRSVSDGDYELVAPPLLVEGADAAPVRAVLRPTRP